MNTDFPSGLFSCFFLGSRRDWELLRQKGFGGSLWLFMRRFIYFPLIVSVVSGAAIAKEAADLDAVKRASGHGAVALERSEVGIVRADLERYVKRLASVEYEGRGTGDVGERMATAYLERYWKDLGLVPEGDAGTYYQVFDFGSAKSLMGKNELALSVDGAEKRAAEVGKDYSPLRFSVSGKVAESGVVFAGYGIETEGYNSFEGLDVKDHWVMVLRGHPEGKRALSRFSALVAKANVAKAKGARGIIFVKGGNDKISSELIKPGARVGGRGDILPAVTVTDAFAGQFFAKAKEGNGEKVFADYAKGEKVAGFMLPVRLSAEIGLKSKKEQGRNVIARLVVGDKPSNEVVVVGGHIDHLGYGNRGGSRARGKNAGKLHLGADDNASGIAVLMELSQYFVNLKKLGKLDLKRDIVFAGWSGEEVGLFGSTHFVKQMKADKGETKVVAYLNMDMVGRFSENGLTLHGTASSKIWDDLLEKVSKQTGVKPKYEASPYLPSDTRPFYAAGVPILAAFTGLHADYHTPADTVDKIDFAGLLRVAEYMRALTAEVASLENAPDHVVVARPGRGGNRPKVRVGIMPANADGGGVAVRQVVPDGPANKAGMQVEDVIVKIDKNEVKNVRQLLAALMQLKAGKESLVVVKRNGKKLDLKLVPEAR